MALNSCFYFENYFIRPLQFVKDFGKLKPVISSIPEIRVESVLSDSLSQVLETMCYLGILSNNQCQRNIPQITSGYKPYDFYHQLLNVDF